VPAQQVGGDFYDVYRASDNGIAIVVGDVSGKGLPASVVAGLLVGAVRASGWTRGRIEHQESTFTLSELLRLRTAMERFASMFWCYYRPESHVLHYINAGHLPPLLVRRVGGEVLNVRHLREGGPVLGLLPAAAYDQGSSAILPGDLLVLFSDGVVEATNAVGEHFEQDRLLSVIRRNFDGSSMEIREEILKGVLGFLGREQAQDDLTLVVTRFTGDRASPVAGPPKQPALLPAEPG
jgi:sigma-B regulation protein RsbU (phosphoserine phosphatase)